MFDYTKAFSRNIGWITKEEQDILRNKRVAIAGAGGVGGEHMVTLARLGVQQFNIADFDEFEVHNFNRQAGAFMSTIGQPKLKTMEAIVKDINPLSDINAFDQGVTPDNVDAFLDGVDIYVDSIDFFAIEARRLVFQKCTEKQIPIVTAAPIGMGTAFLCFMPGKMSPEEYFCFEDAKTKNEQYLKFYIGLAPSGLQRGYLVDEAAVDFVAQKVPSTPMGIKLCAGMAGSYALKILLGRGDVLAAPHALHFDAYKNKMRKTCLPKGNRGLMQRLSFRLAKKVFLPESGAEKLDEIGAVLANA